MKSKITFLIIFLSSFLANAQVEFEDNLVIDSAMYVQSPNSVFSADFDGDGDEDVLTSSYWGNTLVWLENLDGVGGDFEAHTIASNITTAWGVYAADLDADGDMDAVVSSLSGSTLSWFENTDGDGTFILKQATYAYKANFVMAADMDNDNDLDLIWSSHTEGEMKWIKNTDGLGTLGMTYNIESNVTRIPGFFPADIDGDGALDIVAAHTLESSHGVSWYKNISGNDNFGPRTLISSAVAYVTSVYAGDIDGDGDMDVVSSSATDDKIAWYENLDGLGTFSAQQVLTLTADSAMEVRLADLDGDADLDVVFGSNDDSKIGWFENLDGLGNFSGEIFIASHSGDIRDIHFSDMDADGDLDFLTATNIDDNIKLFKNTDGAGTFASTILTKHIDGGRVIVAEDLDGDGDKDIINASYWDDKISWFENLDGQGNFYNTQLIISDTVNGATSVAAGDIDGDGFIDILATSMLDAKVVWFKNIDGLGNFAAPQIIDSNLDQAFRVFVSDIDNDGDMDVFGLGRGRITWYENLNGQGSFSAQQTIDNINNFTIYSLDFGDLDGDGDLDVSAASSYGLLYYLNVDGMGTFGTRQIIESTYDSVSLKIADFDNDGDSDIAYTAENNVSTYAFVGWVENTNGLASFGPIQVITTVISNPTSVTVADFDNDGDIDVASSNKGNNGVIAWYQNTDGQGNFQNTQQIVSQFTSTTSQIIAADIDGNNTVDIVSTSELDKVAWHKNNGTPLSNNINGTVRFDLTGDGCSQSDAMLSGILLVATDNTSTNATFSQENGQFQLYITEEGEVTTQITSQFPTYYQASPATFTSNFTGYGNTDPIHFCIEPIADINDLTVSFYPTINDPRPGFNTGYRIVYRNVGTTQLSGSVTFEYDSTKLDFLTASETISSQTSSTLTFNFTNLNPFEIKTIDVEFVVFAPPVTNINDLVLTTATITPVTGDYTEDDNLYSFSQVVVGSFDPNDITCLEGDEVVIDDADEYLHYLIRFQNTGTASAINVRVDHSLDGNLDWTSMQLETLSHTGRVNIHNGSVVSFIFDNIHLPDSTSNEAGSHGFIAYKIKPKNTVAAGDIINATADIFFDFNPAIVTNTASTEFVSPLSVNESEAQKVTVYPNPTDGILNIISASEIANVDIYNHLGQLVLSATETVRIDISSLSPGVYVMTMKDVTGVGYSQKIIKQ